MSTIRRVPALALAFALTLGTLLAGAPLALAQPLLDSTNTGAGAPPANTPAPAVSHGSPLWTFILVAAVAAAIAVTATWLISSRFRHHGRLSTSPA